MTIYGIDVSNWKFGINLDNVPYDYIGFKATQGRGFRDPYMRQMSDMNRNGKNRDEVYYHFVSEDNTVESEAHNFIEMVKDRLRPQDSICLDWERQGGGLVKYNLEWAQRWMQIVENQLGKRPWVYTGQDNARVFSGSDIAEQNPLWIPHYGPEASTGGYESAPSGVNPIHPFKRVVGWQFTDQGRLPGYDGTLDLNIFNIEPGKGIDWAGNIRESIKVTEQDLAYPVVGAIAEKWRELGGPQSFLGMPTSIEVKTETGAFQRFQNEQYLLWSMSSGAHVSIGEIRKAYGKLDYEHGPNGYPITDELDTRKPGGKYQQYQHGVGYWHPNVGAQFVRGLVLHAYGEEDYEAGPWGFPIGPEVKTENGWYQDFEGGRLGVGGEPSMKRFEMPPVATSKLVIPTIKESDAKLWIEMKGGKGYGCICMKMTLPFIEEEMIRKGLIKYCIDIFQFGYRGDVKASANTHDMGGVIDVAQGITKAQREVWAMYGVIMAPRSRAWGWTGGDHGHGGWYGCVHRHPTLAAQVKNMMNGYNGLVSNTYVDWVKPARTWQDSLRHLGLAA